MKFKFCHVNPKTLNTTVCINHLGKNFYGEARLHPDDRENYSEITGGRYAEMKAEIKALKFERRLKKEKCEECRKFVRACEQYKIFDKSSPTAKAMYTQLGKRIKEVNTITDRINSIYDALQKSDWRRMVVLKAIKRKYKTKEDNSSN